MTDTILNAYHPKSVSRSHRGSGTGVTIRALIDVILSLMTRHTFAGLFLASAVHLSAQKIEVPKTWDDAALKDRATPIAGLGVRPGHFSAEEYYASPLDNYRTYPVYAAGREPNGYWERLQHAKPEPLINPGALRTKAGWTAAGKRVFEEYDLASFRHYEPEIVQEFHESDLAAALANRSAQRRNHTGGLLGRYGARYRPDLGELHRVSSARTRGRVFH